MNPIMKPDPRYPIGNYTQRPFSSKQKETWLADIRCLPLDLEQSLLNLDEGQLQTAYREGGWTVQQLVHHIADSHMNACIRFRLALTEDRPVIKPYDENQWALLPDVTRVPVNVSVTLLHALHTRWYQLLRELPDAYWSGRSVYHPEQAREMDLWYLLGLYAWHGRHHVAQITSLRERMGW
jgi:uncharacterized damage-inducible protein DinB